MADISGADTPYLDIIRDAIRVSAGYQPMFGQGRRAGLTVDQFRELYSADAFYSWFGLDSPHVYAAHRAGGGITSLYRQIGIGCQWALNRILRDQLGLNETDASWSYTVPTPDGKTRTLSLDARIPLSAMRSERLVNVTIWLRQATSALDVEHDAARNGAVFEIRQGYKSKDSKRQNADVANAANAYSAQYLPVVLLLSNQIDSDIAMRYARARWLILRGVIGGTALDSSYVFFRDIVGYDLAAFFARNAPALRVEIARVLERLLGASDEGEHGNS